MVVKAALTSLPLEVIWMVLESILWNRRDLLSLCCVKVFATVATQLFYRHFEGSIHRFLATLALKPELARHVKSVTLDDPHQVRRLRLLRRWERLEQSVYHRSIKQLAVPSHVKDNWVRSLRKGDSGTVVALFLAHLPNLARLTIREGSMVPLTIPFWTQSSPLAWFSGSEPGSLTFGCLEEVTLHTLPFPLQDFYFLFELPTVRKLHVHNMTERRSVHRELRPWSSNIIDLGLHAVSVSSLGLLQMVSACRNLAHFAITDLRQQEIPGDFCALVAALSLHEHTLTTLKLRRLGGRSRERAPCSLRTFSSLREMDCDASVFDGAVSERPLSVLMPPLVRRICIHDAHTRFLHRLGGVKAIQADLVGPTGSRRPLERLEEAKFVCAVEPSGDPAPYNSDEGGVAFAVENPHGSFAGWGWG